MARYVGRFAPSPTGRLHAGSMVAALASWLDARAHGGTWLVRIEDVDAPRCVPGAAQSIIEQLSACGLTPEETPWVQSARSPPYQAALQRLGRAGMAYPCGCSRSDIAKRWAELGLARRPHQEMPYPGTCAADASLQACAPLMPPEEGRTAWRLRLPAHAHAQWTDRRLGLQSQDVRAAIGDFVLRRADGLWAYQLAVVVDDGEQGVTDVVRGEDLADNTSRQILLQRALGLPTPRYLHLPLVLAADGQKLSKQTGAQAIDIQSPLKTLQAAAACLGLPPRDGPVHEVLERWTQDWAEQWLQPRPATQQGPTILPP